MVLGGRGEGLVGPGPPDKADPCCAVGRAIVEPHRISNSGSAGPHVEERNVTRLSDEPGLLLMLRPVWKLSTANALFLLCPSQDAQSMSHGYPYSSLWEHIYRAWDAHCSLAPQQNFSTGRRMCAHAQGTTGHRVGSSSSDGSRLSIVAPPRRSHESVTLFSEMVCGSDLPERPRG